MSIGTDDSAQKAPVIGHRQVQTAFQAHICSQSAQKMLMRGSCTVVCSGGIREQLGERDTHRRAVTSAYYE